jgi:hypothetical protein
MKLGERGASVVELQSGDAHGTWVGGELEEGKNEVGSRGNDKMTMAPSL